MSVVSDLEVIRLMNAKAQAIRRQERLPEQVLDETLCRGAQGWSEDMASRGRDDHDLAWIRQVTDVRYEIVAPYYETVDQVFAAWMESPKHKAAILSNTARVGWGCARAPNGERYWTGRMEGHGKTVPPVVHIVRWRDKLPAWLRRLLGF